MMRLQTWTQIAILLATSVTAACTDTNFKSQSPKKATHVQPPKPEKKKADATLKLACENGKGEAKLVTDLKGSEGTNVRLEGEFCGIPAGAAAGKLTVLFVLDISGSMEDNDPLVVDRCGRLDAGNAIAAKLEEILQEGVDLNVGMLPFNNAAEPGIAPTALATFKAQLTSAVFCRGEYGHGTNYDAAFSAAKDTLSSVEGAKVVYFISDGVPTSFGTGILTDLGGPQDPAEIYDAGRRSAEALRALPDLTLNTIFLGNTAPLDDTDQPMDAQTYLEQITGDKDRVRLVTNAAELAAEIVKFETPEAVTLDTGSVAGTVTASAFGKNDIKLKTLEQDPTREGVWKFVTEPFALFADKAKPVENQVTFTVKGGDGKDYKATALITFAVDEE